MDPRPVRGDDETWKSATGSKVQNPWALGEKILHEKIEGAGLSDMTR
jgi:hypothetical protein